MKYKFIKKKINYNGSELKPLYAYVHHQLHGDSIVAFAGSCDVTLDHMVDAEDFVVGAKIKADCMLHFIVEMFGQNLMTAVSLQRLLVSIVQSHLMGAGVTLIRKGDDLYLKNKKLSVSIASCSAVSSQIHLGINIENGGTPVPTCALKDFSIEPVKFATAIMEKFTSEYISIVEATQKVRPLQ